MRSKQSIQIPLRLDRNRKALMAQLSVNIAKTSITTPKRSQIQQYDERQDLDTLKKKQHIDVNALQGKKQNQKDQKQNDRKFSTQKQIPIKPNYINHSNFIHNTEKKVLHHQQERFDSNLESKKAPEIYSMLDYKLYNFDHLLNEDSKIFSEKQKLFISIQEKLDSHLIFLKQNRKKKKGELFSIIKRTFLENYRIFLDLSHLKKILYIDEKLYSIQKFGEGISFDCLVDINLSCKESDQIQLENQLKKRRNEFRLKLFAYKQNFERNQNQKDFDIPEVRFKFEEGLQNRKNVLKSNVKKLFDEQKKKKLDRFFVLQNKNSVVYEESKKILQKSMKRIESIITKDKELDLGMFTNKMFQKRLLGEKQIKKIINEIVVIYRDRSVFNMLSDQLVESLSKKMILAEDIIKRVLNIFLELSQQVNKQKSFLTLINHRLGRLIKIDSGSAKEFEKRVIMSQNWMKMFEFNMEMNGDYLKQKMQQERDKLYSEIQKQQNQKNKQKQLQSIDRKQQLKQEKVNSIKSSDYYQTKKTPTLIHDLEKAPFGQIEQESKVHYNYSSDSQLIKIHSSYRHSEQLFVNQKEDFRSTLSNSEQFFEQDENLINEVRS